MLIIHKFLKSKKDYIIPLAYSNQVKRGMPFVVVHIEDMWDIEPIKNKFLAILKLKYKPNEKSLQELSKKVFLNEIFGTPDDMAEALYTLSVWHYSRDYKLNDLTQDDNEKSDALGSMTLLTRKRYWELDSEDLNLKLATKNINICMLLCPIVAKTPIISIQYFINIDAHFTFNSIRKSKHKNADEIIAYLYDILNFQQKVAISLHSLVKSISTLSNKNDSVLHQSEIDATMEIENTIMALKASIEKTVLLLGYIFNITNLESKKTHKSKLTALSNNLPTNVKEQGYYSFIEKFISSKELEKLNQYRTGLLHKKGLSKLQPHSHYMKSDSADIFTKYFYDLHEQHSKNSAVLIAVLAILTDELVKLDRPDFDFKDIPCDKLKIYLT